ncbi:MAG: PAS domain S-box protein [Kastovskya adunca ATA6-11-RM4]|jgi:PAS domain S-box-containing protein|nr:PAS domain S-box protein [Kastovskya adunca ATA6-11-RM4]
MKRILILLSHRENCRLLSEWLSIHYEVFFPQSGTAVEPVEKIFTGKIQQQFDKGFDLCILDGPTLDRLWQWVQSRKQAEQPVLLPFLLVTSSQEVGMVSRHLWQSIDELITTPIEKVELQARVEILLRSRQLSLQLQATNGQLQSEIAERQRTESALTKSEARLTSLIQNSSDIIALLEKDGKIRYTSPSVQQILGFNPEDIKGKNHFDFVHPSDLEAALNAFQIGFTEPGNTQISEYRFRHKDGNWLYLESKSNFVDHGFSEVVVNLRDINKRKQAEVEVITNLKKERELIELKSRFVSMVSHEIRTPLNVILASTQILERYSDQWSNQKRAEFYSRIKEAVRKMTELLNDVLLIGKAEFGKVGLNPVPIDIASFCKELVAEIQLSMGEKHKFTFVNHCEYMIPGEPDKLPQLDKKILRHIITNLLSNAVKYSPQSSTIDFEVSYQDANAVFQIRDRGIGIPLEAQASLFEAFYRASNAKNIQGTGLGLAVVKQSVELHGGNITVESELGVGTTFTVTLPLQSLNDQLLNK